MILAALALVFSAYFLFYAVKIYRDAFIPCTKLTEEDETAVVSAVLVAIACLWDGIWGEAVVLIHWLVSVFFASAIICIAARLVFRGQKAIRRYTAS